MWYYIVVSIISSVGILKKCCKWYNPIFKVQLMVQKVKD